MGGWSQRTDAEEAAGYLLGVKAVINLIAVTLVNTSETAVQKPMSESLTRQVETEGRTGVRAVVRHRNVGPWL